MTLPQIISRNQVQKIASVSITARVVLQPNTWYTCPTGKKAIVKGSVQCTGRGAAADASFEVASIEMFKWTANTALDDYLINPRDLRVPQIARFEVELEAGEIIETTQDSGTNAEFNVWAEVLETPA